MGYDQGIPVLALLRSIRVSLGELKIFVCAVSEMFSLLKSLDTFVVLGIVKVQI